MNTKQQKASYTAPQSEVIAFSTEKLMVSAVSNTGDWTDDTNQSITTGGEATSGTSFRTGRRGWNSEDWTQSYED